MYRQWVSCGHNSSYSFPPIVFKLCRCFWHGMKMCIWFWYNSLIIFSHFFCFVNLVIFWSEMLSKCIDSGYLVPAQLLTVFFWLFWNFADVFNMEWRCACGFAVILDYFSHFFCRSVRVAERLALPTSGHGVAGSNPAGGEILPEPKRRFVAQSFSCSSFHRPKWLKYCWRDVKR